MVFMFLVVFVWFMMCGTMAMTWHQVEFGYAVMANLKPTWMGSYASLDHDNRWFVYEMLIDFIQHRFYS